MGLRHMLTKMNLGVRKHSPEILAGVGVVAIVGGVVLACKATMDASDDIKQCKADVDEIKQSIDDKVIDEKAGKKAILQARVKCAKSCAVKYVVPAALVGTGLYCQYKAKSIVGKRLDGVAAAYAALNSRYNILADNVKDQYGEAEFNRLQYGIENNQAVEVKKVNPETGQEETSLQSVDNMIDLSKVGKFTLVFDHNSRWHHTDVIHNEDYIKWCERVFTERLQRTGVLWLCDVMKEMDIRPKSKEEALLSRVICWTYDLSSKNKDCCVTLRAQQVNDSAFGYDTGYNPVFILDPNYDTNINQEWFKYMR